VTAVLELIRTALLAAALCGAAELQADADPLMSTQQQPASQLWPTQVQGPPQAWRGVPRAATPRPLEGDAWLGADKFQHFWMSFATTAYGFAAARAAGIDTGAALYIAVPVSAAAGVGKEIHDRRRGGIFSVRDLVADGLGIAAAWFILREVR
jgi:uncharacterized protein YfiM (DUF2279 family)